MILPFPTIAGLTFVRVSTWSPAFIEQIHAHYTGSAGPPPGKKMGWRCDEDGIPVAWLGLGEPSFKLAARRRLGIEDARPLPGTVSCFIFRRVGGNARGSDILKAWHEVAADAWERHYQWRPEHWETLVLPDAVQSGVPGACFRRAGYRSIGMTTGRSARRPAGSCRWDAPRVWVDDVPKLVLYRGPLARVCPQQGALALRTWLNYQPKQAP